jgi:proteic killer suppression protein
MIKSFSCKETEKIWNRRFSRKLSLEIQGSGKRGTPIARRKLIMIDVAREVSDLRIPPNNRLKKYCGAGKEDKWSIRINDQWRICFYFTDGDAFEVEIVDYH